MNVAWTGEADLFLTTGGFAIVHRNRDDFY
jgi:hypothetical protein